jgi:hypothetical protein
MKIEGETFPSSHENSTPGKLKQCSETKTKQIAQQLLHVYRFSTAFRNKFNEPSSFEFRWKFRVKIEPSQKYTKHVATNVQSRRDSHNNRSLNAIYFRKIFLSTDGGDV